MAEHVKDIIIAGISGAALISWLVPLKKLLGAINMPTARVGHVTFSAVWIIYVGRFLPVVAAALILLAWLA
ncbi:MAG: hypothetical protein JW954_06240 [Dehalococcoidaceae bacterium]|nr:hypothetical protein [Dehalococcoidaceae bacterium]